LHKVDVGHAQSIKVVDPIEPSNANTSGMPRLFVYGTLKPVFWLFALSSAGALFFGVLIVIGGVAQLIEALKCRGWKGVAYHVLIAVLYIFVGVFVIQEPLAAKMLRTAIYPA
jgi:uncharacterized membrane protein HdeD (DUF308 family)